MDSIHGAPSPCDVVFQWTWARSILGPTWLWNDSAQSALFRSPNKIHCRSKARPKSEALNTRKLLGRRLWCKDPSSPRRKGWQRHTHTKSVRVGVCVCARCICVCQDTLLDTNCTCTKWDGGEGGGCCYGGWHHTFEEVSYIYGAFHVPRFLGLLLNAISSKQTLRTT